MSTTDSADGGQPLAVASMGSLAATSIAATSSRVASIYRDHHAWLRQWLRQRLGGAELAADLAHDTFVRLIVSGRLPPASRSRAFLVQIARGLVIDQHRRRQVEEAWRQTLASQPPAVAPSPEARLLVVEALLHLSAALDTLPGRTRRIFLLSQLDGLTYREIASQVGVSVATVRKAMIKATTACLDAIDALDAGAAMAEPVAGVAPMRHGRA